MSNSNYLPNYVLRVQVSVGGDFTEIPEKIQKTQTAHTAVDGS